MHIGIDLGGTKIEAIALDPAGIEQARLRRPTPGGDYAATVAAIGDIVAALESEIPPAAPGARPPVGVGVPGAPSIQTGLIKNANSTCLIGKPLRADLETALGRPVRLANDANCFAVSEAADGAAAGADVVFGAILGTGVGGGVVVHGRALTGANAIAGEWGHNPLPWPRADEGEDPGRRCYCGQRGCIETYLSGPGLAADHRAAAGTDLDPPDIVLAAANGEDAARATLARYHHRLARALASVINVLDPDVIVLGGGLSNMTDLYDIVPRLWTSWVFSDHVETRLTRNRHGDSSGVRGAAWLWPSSGA